MQEEPGQDILSFLGGGGRMTRAFLRNVGVASVLFFCGTAQSATVRFDMEEERPDFAFSAYITLSGDSILEGASSYDYSDAETIEFWGEIDQGWVQFDVLNPEELGFAGGPREYYLSPYGSYIYLSETTTNPGVATNWMLLADEMMIPGTPNDYGVSLRKLDGSEAYTEEWLYGHPAWSSVVPIPGAVWLFGSALAGLGWFRRRKIA